VPHRARILFAELNRFVAVDLLILNLLDESIDERTRYHPTAPEMDQSLKGEYHQCERAKRDWIHHQTAVMENLQKIPDGDFAFGRCRRVGFRTRYRLTIGYCTT
jgi:hypothetical protein